jgi:hypothetical protein
VKILLDQVNRGGLRSTLFTDPDHKTPIIRTYQDCTAILEENRRLQRAYDARAQHRNAIGARRVASIPLVVWAQLERIGIVKGTRILDEQALFKLLSDPELRGLRTDNGKPLA